MRACNKKFDPAQTTLVLNCNKRPNGKGSPQAKPNVYGKIVQWGGMTWKEIMFKTADGKNCN